MLEAGLAEKLKPSREVVYLENDRTVGASGAWNTALDFLVGQVDEPSRVFVAILDDDDAWASGYLEQCVAAPEDDLDMVACGLRRIESAPSAPMVSEAPESLRAQDFLTGNPGIQGSNLFVRLFVLLAGGGFDEGADLAAMRHQDRGHVDTRIAAMRTPGSRACGHQDRPRGHEDREHVDTWIGHVDTKIAPMWTLNR